MNEILNEEAVLNPVIESVRDILASSTNYSLSKELNFFFENFNRNKRRRDRLTNAEFGGRCYVSRETIRNWRNGLDSPGDRERVKELGMAMGFNAEQLSAFLKRNGYPGITTRSLQDTVARAVLHEFCGQVSVVGDYRDALRLCSEGIGLASQESLFSTTCMYSTTLMEWRMETVERSGRLRRWIMAHRANFYEEERSFRPSKRLRSFLIAHLSGRTIVRNPGRHPPMLDTFLDHANENLSDHIRDSSQSGEFPPATKTFFKKLVRGEKINENRDELRDSLLVLGLFLNMSEDELDTMMSLANLESITKSTSTLDRAISEAVYEAHLRYPYYEKTNIDRALYHFHHLSRQKTPYEETLLSWYAERKRIVDNLADFYDNANDEENRVFQFYYTAFQEDRGLADFLKAVLERLVQDGTVPRDARTVRVLRLLNRG